MRVFLVVLLFSVGLVFGVSAEPADSLNIPERPVPNRFVNDFSHVLNSDQAANLEGELRTYSNKYHQQIAIVIMDSTRQENLEDYAQAMVRKWKIGYEYDEKGILILVEMNTKKVVVGVADGLENQISPTNSLAMIKKDVIPAFSKSDYYQGLRKCVNGLEVLLIPLDQLKAYSAPRSGGKVYFILAGLVLILAIVGYRILFKNTPAA